MITKNKGLNRTTLKMVALVSMLIDHIGAFIVYPLYMDACMVDGVDMMGSMIPDEAKRVYIIYMIMRSIGRLAFPIFAFMITEGFLHTKNIRKYLSRLFVFAIISEIPYDLANFNTLFYPLGQNVLWTFTIAILMLCSLEKYALKENSEKNVPLMTVIVIIAAILSFLSDGGVGGILLIASMYIFREKRIWYWIGCIIATIVMAFNFMWIQIFAIVGILLLKLYNETKGRKCKMLFYVFYPLHLLVLAGIALIIVL